MQELVIDTNALIFYVIEDSKEHAKADKVLNSLSKWYVPTIVIYELAWFFRSINIPAEKVAEIITSIVKYGKTTIVCEGDAIEWALHTMLRMNLGLGSFNDMVILGIAHRLGKPLLTFDKRLRRRAGRLGIKVLDV